MIKRNYILLENFFITSRIYWAQLLNMSLYFPNKFDKPTNQ